LKLYKQSASQLIRKYLIAHPDAGRTEVGKYIYHCRGTGEKLKCDGSIAMPFSNEVWLNAKNSIPRRKPGRPFGHRESPTRKIIRDYLVLHPNAGRTEVAKHLYQVQGRPLKYSENKYGYKQVTPPFDHRTWIIAQRESKNGKKRFPHHLSGPALIRECLTENPTAKNSEVARYVYEKQGRRYKKNILPFSGLELMRIRHELGIRGTRWRGVYSCRKPHKLVIRHDVVKETDFAELVRDLTTAKEEYRNCLSRAELAKSMIETIKRKLIKVAETI
jgi:hypothetical protein